MKTVLPLVLLAIEDNGFHLSVEVVINGRPANLILDTGASKSVFDENRIYKFIENHDLEEQEELSTGLGTNTMRSKMTVFDELKLHEIKVVDYLATILDLAHINQSYEKLGLKSVDGVLGGDILLEYNAVIDYENKELILQNFEG